MSATRVVSLRHGEPFDVRIDRRTRWGNPYHVPDTGERAGVIEQYRAYLLASPVLRGRLPELRGKTLACWCAPQGGLTADDKPYVCHGQVLAELADMTEATP